MKSKIIVKKWNDKSGEPPTLQRVTPAWYEGTTYLRGNEIKLVALHEGAASQTVSDLVGDDYENWNANTPVFIEAPTGHGKNLFVAQKIFPAIIKKKSRMLLLVNRKALNTQQNFYYAKMLGKAIAENTKLSLELDAMVYSANDIGPITIMTYQALAEIMCHGNLSDWIKQKKIALVVFDEIHFLDADALFNADTGYLMDNLASAFTKCVRIYMTATPSTCFPPLILLERQKLNSPSYWNTILPQVSIGYRIPADYRAYSFRFFSTYDEIVDELVQILRNNPQDKALLLLNNKGAAEMQKNNLQLAGVSAAFVSADGRDDTEAYHEIIKSECFKESVLLSTSVLINGVTIKDENLRHIVVSSTDPADVLQFVGRKRMSKNSERTTVYLHIPPKEDLALGLRKVSSAIDFLMAYRNALKSRDIYELRGLRRIMQNDTTLLKYFFITVDGKFTINSLALEKLFRYQNQLTEMVALYREGRNSLARWFLSIFGMADIFSDSMWLDFWEQAKGDSPIQVYLESMINVPLYKQVAILQDGTECKLQIDFYQKLNELALGSTNSYECKITGKKLANEFFCRNSYNYEITSEPRNAETQGRLTKKTTVHVLVRKLLA